MTHFGHKLIIDFCNRPFSDVEEMNNKLIENWNSVVPKNGLVFHLGDFAWGGGYNAWKKIREQLNGEIILIEGNHDRKNMAQSAKNELFKYVTWQMLIEIEGRRVLLNHYPFLCYSGIYRSKDALEYNIHGHVHLTRSNPKGKDIERVLKYEFPTQYDVGVDFNNYAPISWNELNLKVQTQIGKNENMKIWMEN